MAHRNQLARLRGSLRKQPQQPVKGGVVGRHGYASWVDDVIWHATPDFKNRPSVTKDTLMGQYDRDSSFANQSARWPLVIRTLAEFPDSAVAQHLESEKILLKEVKDDDWKDIWNEVYVLPGRGVLDKDLGNVPDATLRFNRFFSPTSESIAHDPALPLDRQGKPITGQQIKEQVVGLATRRRANSDPQIQKAVRAAQDLQDQKGETRSFIRTWVKIVRLSKTQ
jgi:hypothetical protein